MPRNKPFRKISLDEELARLLERRMLVMHRKESLTSFIEWVLLLYSKGYLEETDAYKQEIEKQINMEFTSRKIHRVGTARGIIEEDEGKRKAS